MKQILTFFICLFLTNGSFAQQYLGTITQKASLRESPDKTSELLDQLSPNANVFVYDKEPTNGYYNIIDIATDQEGWVHKSSVKLIKPLSKNERGVFAPSEQTDDYQCNINVENATSMDVTLKIQGTFYYLEPEETKTITLSPGSYDYVASAPGIIPYFGEEDFKSGYRYSWKFYIRTTYGTKNSVNFKYKSKRKRK